MKTLRPYQITDAEFIKNNVAVGVFNQQRTGKTPTVLSALNDLKPDYTVVICPSSIVYQWASQIEEWTDLKARPIVGVAKKRSELLSNWTKDEILIISYDTFKSTSRYEGEIDKILKFKPKCIVLDEAHRIGKRGTAVNNAIKKTNKIPRRIALTATPATNKAEDIYPILNWLRKDLFPSYWKGFIDRFFHKEVKVLPYATLTEVGSLTPDGAKELQQIMNTFCIRRTRKEVMPWLKEIGVDVISLPLTPKQIKYMDDLANYHHTETVYTQGVLDRCIRYRQICNDPKLLNLKGTSPKTDWIKQFLQDYPDTPVLIFSKFTSYLKKLAEELGTTNIIAGDTQLKQRETLRNQFQHGIINVLLINTDSGKEGLTLDRAEVTIFTDTYPPVADILQARDRMTATTEDKADKPAKVIELIMKDSFEEEIHELVQNNMTEVDLVNNFNKYIGGKKHEGNRI